jgi:hypothetical protein
MFKVLVNVWFKYDQIAQTVPFYPDKASSSLKAALGHGSIP